MSPTLSARLRLTRLTHCHRNFLVQTPEERVKLVYLVKIEAPNPTFDLKPGMPADAAIEVGP